MDYVAIWIHLKEFYIVFVIYIDNDDDFDLLFKVNINLSNLDDAL